MCVHSETSPASSEYAELIFCSLNIILQSMSIDFVERKAQFIIESTYAVFLVSSIFEILKSIRLVTRVLNPDRVCARVFLLGL